MLAALLVWQGAESITNERARKLIDSSLAKYGSRVEGDYTLETDLIAGSFTLQGLHLRAIGMGSTSICLTGDFDTISFSGIAWIRALVTGKCNVQRALISARGPHVVFSRSAGSAGGPDAQNGQTFWKSLRIDEVEVHLTAMGLTIIGDSVIESQVAGVQVTAEKLHVPFANPTISRWENLAIVLDNFDHHAQGGYGLAVDHVELAQQDSTIRITGIHLVPDGGLLAFNESVQIERDVFEGRIDSISISRVALGGLDPEDLGHGGSVRIGSGAITVLRDKSKRNAAYRVKPLLASLVRSFGPGRGVDTLRLSRIGVTYMERDENGGPAARIPFQDIAATITGMRAHPGSEIDITASATVFDGTPVSLALNAPVDRSDERFTMDARIGPLPFRSLNKAMVPLTDLAADEGRLDTLVMKMTADATRGRGSIALVYHDLRFKSASKDAKGSLTTALLGLLPKSNRAVDGMAETVEFEVERRKDRAIFNYLWLGLREGVKNGLLPRPLGK